MSLLLFLACTAEPEPEAAPPEPEPELLPLSTERLLLEWSTNGYVLGTSEEALVVDPGSHVELIDEAVGERELHTVLLTHGHFDHITALDELVALRPEARVVVHAHDAPWLYDHTLNLSSSYVEAWEYTGEVDLELEGQPTLDFAGRDLPVLYLPGHTDSSVGLYVDELGCAYVGDTLMQGTIGYADWIPGADQEQLLESLWSELLVLPQETVIHAGHGEPTTIGEELESNLELVEP